MTSLTPAQAGWLADGLLIAHAGIVAFNLGLPPLAWIGHWRGWGWVRRRWVGRVHLGLMGVVVLIALAGAYCPLTVWESALREQAGQTGYEGSFVGYWIGRMLYYDVAPWVIGALYSGWFGLSVWTWRRVSGPAATAPAAAEAD